MEIQEKLAVEYFIDARHPESEKYIIKSYLIRKNVLLHFRWIMLEIKEELFNIHQN